jgi:hypothetical protein
MITRRTVFAIPNEFEEPRLAVQADEARIHEGFRTHSFSRANSFPQKPIFLSYTLTVLRRVIRLHASKNDSLGRLISPA